MERIGRSVIWLSIMIGDYD